MVWTHFMIHCTDTPPTYNVTRKDIEKWHLDERGWSRVGYSMLIERFEGLDILIPFDRDDSIDSWEISNGAAGWNGFTKHIAWSGGKGTDGKVEYNMTTTEESCLTTVCRITVMLYPQIKLIGHNQVHSTKYCPSFDVRKYAKAIGIPDKNIDFHKYVDNPFLS